MTENDRQEYYPAGDRVSIFLRGRSWYCNYQQNDRQVRKSLGTSSKKEAILRAQRLETELAHGQTPNQIRIATLTEIIEAFLAHAVAEDRAPKTLSKYQSVTEEIAKLATERNVTRVDGLSFRFADAYKQSLKKNGNKPKTIYNKLVVLRSVTIFAKRRKMCDQDPLEGYGLKKPKATSQPCWTPGQADQIVDATPMSYRPYFTFLRETGCRAGEGKFLTWDDVKFDQGTILIRPKEGPWGSWRPKSGDQRSVPMTQPLEKLLKSISKQGLWVFCAPSSKRYPSIDRQISERRALSALKRVLSKLSLPGKLHTFRHTYISQALTRGVPEAVVRQWVGHVDPEILRLYTHVADDVSQAYMARFSGKSEQKS
jgi:integrase